MAVNEQFCGRQGQHGPHGWVSPDQLAQTHAIPAFLKCPGTPLPEPAAPERAGREGDVQPLPVGTDEVDTQTLAMQLIDARRDLGIRRYGHPLQPTNGRDSLWDATEEALDLYVYLVNAWRAAHPGKPLPGLAPTPAPEAL